MGSRRTEDPNERQSGSTWLRLVPPARWLADYRLGWLSGDIVAGITLAAYAVPVSLAYAGLAGLQPQVGDAVLESVLSRLRTAGPSKIHLVVCDLSASPFIDLAGSRMLHDLHSELSARGITLRIVGAHGRLRDLLRADNISEKVGGLDRVVTLDSLLGGVWADHNNSARWREK